MPTSDKHKTASGVRCRPSIQVQSQQMQSHRKCKQLSIKTADKRHNKKQKSISWDSGLGLGLGRGMPNTSAVELKKKTKYPGVLIRRWCFRREDSSAFSFLYIYLRAAPRLMRRGGAAASKFVRRRGLAVFPLDASH